MFSDKASLDHTLHFLTSAAQDPLKRDHNFQGKTYQQELKMNLFEKFSALLANNIF